MVLRSAVHPIQWMRVICCGIAVKRKGILGMRMRQMKGMTVKMETVTLTGKGRYNPTCFVYQV
jgi:hypothetical protein